ncbi:MAG: hypothetical protein LBL81_01145 [Tannerella sp.]|jgi:DNA polymerase-3 subunit gamma/tau|nr:hypothetical protein [Tannerella sp.]
MLKEDKPSTPAVVAEVDPQTAKTRHFTQEELLAAWDAYAMRIDKNAYLKAAMANCKPQLKEKALFEVTTFNSVQQEELQNDSVHLLPILRHALGNDLLRMRVVISETAQKRVAYTPEEKYQYLVQKNPALEKLRQTFNLRY